MNPVDGYDVPIVRSVWAFMLLQKMHKANHIFKVQAGWILSSELPDCPESFRPNHGLVPLPLPPHLTSQIGWLVSANRFLVTQTLCWGQ
jgi:hypothetical protein